MRRKKYKIEYLPAADQDLADIITYIAVDLAVPMAAANLLEKVERAITLLETFPFAYAVYQPAGFQTQDMPFEFRSLVVGSYVIFYYVTDNAVTIARVVYAGRDMSDVLS